jgi:hypothetical protein
MEQSGYVNNLVDLPPRKTTGTYLIGGYVSLRVGQNTFEKRKGHTGNRNPILRSSSLYPIHYVDNALPAPT